MGKTLFEKLLTDVDYQKIPYEKRVDNFNKYGYQTSMLFFTPAYHLANYVISLYGTGRDDSYGYGHGKALLDVDMIKKSEKNYDIDSRRDTQYFSYKKHDNGIEILKSPTSLFRGTYITFIFRPERKVDKFYVKVNYNYELTLPSFNIYDKIVEWLTWFEFIESGEYLLNN